VTLFFQPPGPSLQPPSLSILYEDDYLLVLNKPAGAVVHPAYKNPDGTVLDALRTYAERWPAGYRPSLVGRLDKPTSGLLVVAKTSDAHAALQRTLASSASEKDYLAIVYGRVEPARGEIDLRLGPDSQDRRRRVASADTGSASITRFERLDEVAAPSAGLSLLRCRLVTGRRHQIRVHLAARGWPIVGDPTYGEPRWSHVHDAALAATLSAFPRQALHAWRLALRHPVTGEPLELEAPVPADLVALMAACGFSGILLSRSLEDTKIR
jgi:23S rRNA pseudouridine1911/1915/1917 synthase